MHLVLRSSKAKGDWSFRRPQHRRKIIEILDRFGEKYGVRRQSYANVGNHLHLQIQLTNRATYKPFIRAVTAAIAMAVTGINRWTVKSGKKLRFWDYRPFTRIVVGYRALLTLKDYILINNLEGFGVDRRQAQAIIHKWSSA